MFQNAEQNNVQEVRQQRPYQFHKLTSMGLSLFDIRNWYRACLHLKKIGEEVVYQSLTTWHLFQATEQTGQGYGNDGVTIRSCPLCLRMTENEGLELRPAEYEGSPAFVPENGSLPGQNGCWIFISDIEDFIGEPDNGGDQANPPAGPAEVEDASTQSAPVNPKVAGNLLQNPPAERTVPNTQSNPVNPKFAGNLLQNPPTERMELNTQSAPVNPNFAGNLLQNPLAERTETVLTRAETRKISATTKSTSNKQKNILTRRLKSAKRGATSLVIDKDLPLVFSKPKRPRSGTNN